MTLQFRRINHVTVAVPAGEHEKVRAFYSGTLGFQEVPIPQVLQSHYDLIWFQMLDILLHVDFSPPWVKPAENRHVCLEVKDIKAAREHFIERGADLREAVVMPDRDRFYVLDPFGNYFEIVEFHKDQAP